MQVKDEDELDLDNRRRAPRVTARLPVRYVGPCATVRSTVTLNLSLTGARLILDRDETEVTLQLNDEVDVLARKVWEAPLNGGKRIAGVVFEAMNAGQRAALQRLVERLAA